MDKITRGDVRGISPQTEREFTSPLSPKRPRIVGAMTDDHSGERRFDFPELFAFRKTTGSPSSISTLQQNADLTCTAECGDIEEEKPLEQEDSKLIVTSITKLTTLHADDAHTRSPKPCFITSEGRFALVVKDEQSQVTESDKLSSYPLDDAGGALAESQTSEDTSADTSSHPDCKWLGESLEDEPPGSCNLPTGNGEDGRLQNSVNQIQAFGHSLSDEEVRWGSGCTHEDTSFCNTWSQSTGIKESENILFRKEEEEGNSPILFSDYANTKSFSNPEENPSGNLAESVKNEEKILELQICENENVLVCDGETQGHVNENGPSKKSIPSAAECAEGSIVSYDVVSARNVAIGSVSLEADDFCGAKEEHAAGKMIAKARSETAGHTQEPAEGDNDEGPFSVIDPAIWSETDREERRCNSESTAGAELPQSVKVCEVEMLLPLNVCDVGPSQEVSAPNQTRQFYHQSGTQQREDEKEDLCQSYTEPHACPTGEGRQESYETVGHQLKEPDQSGCFPVSLDHLKTQEVEYVQTEIDRLDGTTEIKEREEVTFEEEIRTDEHGKSENSEDFDERHLQQNEKHKEDTTEISTCDCINGWTAGEISKGDGRLTHMELGNNLEYLIDHPHNVVIPIMKGTTEESERKEETDVQVDSEIFVTSEGTSPQKGDMSEASPLTLVGQHEQGNKLPFFSKYQQKAETFMVENKDDLSAFTFPTSSDAVVPALHDLIPSQNADNNPTALNRSDRFSQSAFAFCDLRGIDTFKKIQLSLDDDDDDDDAGLSPLLTSLPTQLLRTPQRQLYHSMPEEESNKNEEVPEEEEEEKEGVGEEEVERFECHTENMANGFSSSDYSCNELPNFNSAADVPGLGQPELQPNSEAACDSFERFQDDLNPRSVSSAVSSKSDSPGSDVNDRPKFEMKNQFEMVLKELNLYFDISRSEFASNSSVPSPEKCCDVTEAFEDDSSRCKEQLSSPELRQHGDASDDADEDRSLDMCGGDPVVSCSSGSGDGEQEVPLGSRLCQEASVNTAEKYREPPEMEQKRKMRSPSFMCRPFLEQLSHRPPETRRLQPLRTCTRPIRVGLSKRAKTKHLHPPHPY